MAEKQAHSILLIQITDNAESRTFHDFETVTQCIDGVSKLYEDYLKAQFPFQAELSYELAELLHFIDELNDLSCLVFQKASNKYIPYNKDWIKQRVYIHFTRQIKED